MGFQKFLNRVERLFLLLSVVATLFMMFLTTVDTVGRYLFNKPIIGAYEITEKYLMVAVVFFGLTYAYKGGSYIRVTFLVDRLPQKVKLMINYFIQIYSIVL